MKIHPLLLFIGIVAIVVVVSSMWKSDQPSAPLSTVAADASDSDRNSDSIATAKPEQDYCAIAEQRHNAGVRALIASDYQKAYDFAVSGLHAIELCDDPDRQMLDRAYLLSTKGLSEHYLPVGDSRTDLNQANQLLEECVTKPGWYGTPVAAHCETEQHNNISTQTNWDVYGN